MTYTLKGLESVLTTEGINSKQAIIKAIKGASSEQLKGLEHDLKILIVKKIIEERKKEKSYETN